MASLWADHQTIFQCSRPGENVKGYSWMRLLTEVSPFSYQFVPSVNLNNLFDSERRSGFLLRLNWLNWQGKEYFHNLLPWKPWRWPNKCHSRRRASSFRNALGVRKLGTWWSSSNEQNGFWCSLIQKFLIKKCLLTQSEFVDFWPIQWVTKSKPVNHLKYLKTRQQAKFARLSVSSPRYFLEGLSVFDKKIQFFYKVLITRYWKQNH